MAMKKKIILKDGLWTPQKCDVTYTGFRFLVPYKKNENGVKGHFHITGPNKHIFFNSKSTFTLKNLISFPGKQHLQNTAFDVQKMTKNSPKKVGQK